MKYKFILSIIILSLIFFYTGFLSGKYVQSIKIESTYPYHLREIFVSNQPNCNTYNYFIENNISLDTSIVTNDKNEYFVKVVSLFEKEEEIRFVLSILNKDQEQFIDEVWLDCVNNVKNNANKANAHGKI